MLKDKGTMHEITNNDNRASMPGYVSCTGNLVRQKLLSNAKKVVFFYVIAMKMNRQILSLGETLVYLHLEKLCLFWSIQFYCRGKRNRKFITINNNNDNNNNNFVF